MFKAKYDYRSIKSIQLIETVPTKCLEVDSESHIFIFLWRKFNSYT